MLFGKKKLIVSPVNGRFIPIEQVNDPVFAEGMMGDGVAVIPSENTIVSPVEGTITMLSEQKHGIGITMEGGTELLIHMGIDTVELGGKPFEINVQQNDQVKPGDALATMDVDMVRAEGRDPVIMIIATGKTLKKKKYSQEKDVSVLDELAKIE
ncbi:PTS glucose transporter subunit IIA [Enterococcus sp. 669A]|uniref:PTS glucose transporter subunit IIA n=1 Tax=Candidatus Enterococcus moelleringii TaxID=2815325 RepID=A0ABS3LEL8_9ENTE|nr:PTS glucose transporter subunit IIA [Enterococcus sp. 669A]